MVYAEYIGYFYLSSDLTRQFYRSQPDNQASRGLIKVITERARRQYAQRPLDAAPLFVSIEVEHPVDSEQANLVVVSSTLAQTGLTSTQFSGGTVGHMPRQRPLYSNIRYGSLLSARRRRFSASKQSNVGASTDSLAHELSKEHCNIRASNMLLSMHVDHLFSVLERHTSCCSGTTNDCDPQGQTSNDQMIKRRNRSSSTMSSTTTCSASSSSSSCSSSTAIPPNSSSSALRTPLLICHVFSCMAAKEAQRLLEMTHVLSRTCRPPEPGGSAQVMDASGGGGGSDGAGGGYPIHEASVTSDGHQIRFLYNASSPHSSATGKNTSSTPGDTVTSPSSAAAQASRTVVKRVSSVGKAERGLRGRGWSGFVLPEAVGGSSFLFPETVGGSMVALNMPSVNDSAQLTTEEQNTPRRESRVGTVANNLRRASSVQFYTSQRSHQASQRSHQASQRSLNQARVPADAFDCVASFAESQWRIQDVEDEGTPM